MSELGIEGTWDDEFEPLAGVFADVLAGQAEGGGALSVWVAGRPVLDAWGGLARPRDSTPWAADTLAVTFSCTKGLLASCALLAAQDGALDLDAPVAAYWPELGASADGLTARMVLAHRAGLVALDGDLSLDDVLDGTPVVAALERQATWWKPGAGHAYHAMTYGWLVAEILHRSTGRPLAAHLDALLAGPDRDTWLGLPDGAEPRLAEAAWDLASSDLDFPPDHAGVPWRARALTRSITLGTAFGPELLGPGSGLNDPRVLRAGIPAVGIVSTARSLASAWARLVSPVDGRPPLLDARRQAEAAWCRSEGATQLGTPPPYARWASGHMVRSPLAPMLGDASFGHDGAGGQLGFADPATGTGFAFLTNVLRNRQDDRGRRLVDALRDLLR